MANPWDNDPVVAPFDLKGALSQTDKMLGLPDGFSAAQIKVESGGNPQAVSPAGALGLAQVMRATLKAVSQRLGRELDPMNPADAVQIHREVMRENLQKFGTPDKALMAYNGGWDQARWNNPETRAYVGKVSAAMKAQDQNPVMAAVGKVVNAVMPSAQAASAQPWANDPVVTKGAGNPWDSDPVVKPNAASQIANDAITQGAKNFTNDMPLGALGRGAAGAGMALTNLVRGAGQLIPGLVSRQDVAESRKLDAPLLATTAGKVGNFAGTAVPLAATALIPGANTLAGSAAIGSLTGLLQPSTSTGETLTNIGLGGVGGAAGQAVANFAGRAVAGQVANNAATVAKNAQKTTAARNASDAGYVIPPEDLGEGGGLVTKILSGVGGKIKTAQEASQRNQGVTNDLAKKALGLQPTDTLDASALASIRDKAGQAYDVVKNSGTITADPAYVQALDSIGAQSASAAKAFPGAVKSDIPDLIAALKQPSFDADGAVEMTKVLRKGSDKAFASGDKDLGAAMRKASDALEGMMERHLQASGNPDALKAFQDARQLIAKTYSVQKGLNGTTGDVAAGALAKQLEKGKPLSGDLRTIAEASQGFPKATQALKEAPKSLSPLDMALAVIQRDPMGLLTLGARPAARSLMLSRPMQNSALNAASTPQNANALLRALSQEQLTLPAGLAGSNALAAYLAQQQ
jgi:hypothetical protein